MPKKKLDLGKVYGDTLEKAVLSCMPIYKEASLDANTIQTRGKIAISHNPALGLPLETLGFFAFHYAASNVAMRFARPKYIIIGINLPPESTEEELKTITKNLGAEAKRYGVEVVAGHTGVYKGINVPLVSATCIGNVVRRPEPTSHGDPVVILGSVGAEAIWLQSLADSTDLKKEDAWRQLTPLPPALELLKLDGIRFLHDVSEGGAIGAVYDISRKTKLKLSLRSDLMPFAKGVENLRSDPLRSPSYGVLVAVIKKNTWPMVLRISRKMGYACSLVGKILKGNGAYIDGVRVENIERTRLDEIYGTFLKRDRVLKTLTETLAELEKHPEISRLIPEIGTNMVYSRPDAASLLDVAGLSGRVVVSQGRPRVCGEVAYGGSKHVALVLLEAIKLNSRVRAAVNIKGRQEVADALEATSIDVSNVKWSKKDEPCSIAAFINCSKEFSYAYYHPGSFAIEPSIVLLSKEPDELLNRLLKVAEHVRDKTRIRPNRR